MTMLFQAHSGVRYLVLLVGVLALLACLYSVATGRPVRAAQGLTSAFTGLLDLQILLGLGLVIGGIFYDALVGHLVMMALAAVVAHVSSVRAKRAQDERKATMARLIGVGLALVLIVGGIMSIGRSVIGSGAPTLG